MGERLRVRAKRQTKAEAATGDRPAAGLVERAVTLRKVYKGQVYVARLLPNGTIRFGGKAYSSPSGAAKAIRKRPTNGWSFWRMKDQRGEWRNLAHFRS